MRRLIALFALVACRDKPAPAPAPAPKHELTGAYKPGDNLGVATPTGAGHAGWILPDKDVPFTRPTRARNEQEDILYGTWVAKVGDYATRSAFMADRVMFAIDGGSGKDLVTEVSRAIANDSKVTTSCIWLELRPDFTGIRRECAIVNGEPSALDQTDFATGAKKDFGTPLQWFVDDQHRVVIHFGADMVVPAVQGGKLRTLVFRTWMLVLGKKVGDNTFTVTESIPEHDYTLPTQYAYEIVPRRFLDQK